MVIVGGVDGIVSEVIVGFVNVTGWGQSVLIGVGVGMVWVVLQLLLLLLL